MAIKYKTISRMEELLNQPITGNRLPYTMEITERVMRKIPKNPANTWLFVTTDERGLPGTK